MTANSKLWKAIGYKPHDKQLEFHTSNARFKVPVCGRRFGKSRMAAAEIEPYLLGVEPTRGWIVGPEYKTGEKEFRYLWQDVILTMKLKQLGLVKRAAYNMRTGEMYIEMANGSRVDVMSAEHADGLVGEGLHWLIVSEAAKQSPQIWEKYLRPALADYKGKAIFPSTPEGFNWYYDVYKLGQDDRYQEWDSWRYPSWENPYVYPGGFDDPEIQGQMRTPDDPHFWQEIGADFRSVVGLIYPEWDAQKHVRPVEYNPAWPVDIAYDPGFANAFAGLYIQQDPMDTLHVIGEHYEKQKTRYQNVELMRDHCEAQGWAIRCAYGDAADPDTAATFRQLMGVPAVAMEEAKEWSRGVDAVKDVLAAPGSGESRLQVDVKCENFRREIEQYKTRQPPRGRDPRENLKEEPQKKDDHLMDAFRYYVMHKFVIGADAHLTRDMIIDPVIDKLIEPPVDRDTDLGAVGDTFFSWDRIGV